MHVVPIPKTAHHAVMYNQSKDKISSSVELQEIVDKITGVIDPAKLVKLKLSTPEIEKEYIIKNGPNQPDKSVLTCTSLQGSHIPDIVPPSVLPC